MLIDTFLIISTVLVLWLGWSTGLSRTFFAVLTGFAATLAAHKYPDNDGLNFYVVFAITALFIILIGAFTIRVIHFFYLNLLDKLLGAAFSVCVWFLIAINIVTPSLTSVPNSFTKIKDTVVYMNISKIIHSKVPSFKGYVPGFIKERTSEK
ncbi:MAG: CvpA family protein [Elusimicrobiota bacterium]|nr:CvpA family protein [Elusimicrobiota bacterium]